MANKEAVTGCAGCRRFDFMAKRGVLAGMDDFRSDVEAFAQRIGYEVVYAS